MQDSAHATNLRYGWRRGQPCASRTCMSLSLTEAVRNASESPMSPAIGVHERASCCSCVAEPVRIGPYCASRLMRCCQATLGDLSRPLCDAYCGSVGASERAPPCGRLVVESMQPRQLWTQFMAADQETAKPLGRIRTRRRQRNNYISLRSEPSAHVLHVPIFTLGLALYHTLQLTCDKTEAKLSSTAYWQSQ